MCRSEKEKEPSSMTLHVRPGVAADSGGRKYGVSETIAPCAGTTMPVTWQRSGMTRTAVVGTLIGSGGAVGDGSARGDNSR